MRLFRSNELPDDFGWILRADQREWDHFIHSFDKLLSDNIVGGALNRAKVPKLNERGDRLGTLGRLELFMTMNHVKADTTKWAVKPLRAIRAARQKPAHALHSNVRDQTFVRKQSDLLHDVNEVLINSSVATEPPAESRLERALGPTPKTIRSDVNWDRSDRYLPAND